MEGPIPDDETLRTRMVEYQAGSLDAFQMIYAEVGPPLRRYLGYLARRADVADDLLQETFLQLHRSRASFNPAYAVRPWLFGLARYVFLMHRRASRRYEAVHDGSRDVPDVPVPPEIDSLADRELLQRALAVVNEAQVEPLLLHHVWGFSFDEIAGMLGLTPATARARSSRGMAELRRRLTGGGETR